MNFGSRHELPVPTRFASGPSAYSNPTSRFPYAVSPSTIIGLLRSTGNLPSFGRRRSFIAKRPKQNLLPLTADYLEIQQMHKPTVAAGHLIPLTRRVNPFPRFNLLIFHANCVNPALRPSIDAKLSDWPIQINPKARLVPSGVKKTLPGSGNSTARVRAVVVLARFGGDPSTYQAAVAQSADLLACDLNLAEHVEDATIVHCFTQLPITCIMTT